MRSQPVTDEQNKAPIDEMIEDTFAKEDDSLRDNDDITYLNNLKDFYQHLGIYIFINVLLLVINVFLTPQYYWVLWCIGGWGVGLLIHYVYLVKSPDIFDQAWQEKQLAKRKNKH